MAPMNRVPRLMLSMVLMLAVLIPTAAAVGSRTAPARTVVTTAFNKHLKKTILVDGKGRTLYMYVLDTNGAVYSPKDPPDPAWPALTSGGAPAPGKGVDANLLKIVQGHRGARQVSYNGHPLYRFSGDSKPGDAKGQNFYQDWFVLSPKGTPIK